MRTPTDALRSLKKYVADSLGPGWEVRLAGEEGAFRRPFARVGAATGFRTRPHGMLMVELTQPFSIVCHPEVMASPDLAKLEAARVQMLLVTAFSVGTHVASQRIVGSTATTATAAVSVRRAHPMRVPLYDYTGIGVNQAATPANRARNDFMRVTGDVTVDVIADPNDDLRHAVAAAATMSWVVSAAVLSDAMTVRTVTAEGEGT